MSRSSDDPRLPAPRRVARGLIRLAWGADAEAVAGDLAESLEGRRRGGAGEAAVWLRGWREVISAVLHGLVWRLPRGRRARPLLALQLAVRGLRRDPGTSIAAAGVLALGLAAATTFFSILHGLTRPLPVPDGHRVVRMEVVLPAADGRSVGVTAADLERWRGLPALAGVGGVRTGTVVLRDPGRSVARVAGATLTPGVLELLGVAPVTGRLPRAGESGPSLVVSSGLVSQLDLGDGTLEVDGRPLPVVAVMPEDFGFPFGESLWVVEDGVGAPEAHWEPVARLADGADRAGLREQLQARWSGADAARGDGRAGGVVVVKGFTQDRGERGEWFLFLGLVLIGVALLVIACANVAGLLVVRATERLRALAVQAALGAGRSQLALQLLAESLLLAALGGVGGLLLATGLARWVEATLGPENFGYYWIRVAVDARVVAFAGCLVLGTALVAGLLPVVRVWRTDLQGVLKSEAGSTRGTGALGRGFVTAQLALSCAALVAAGLTVGSIGTARDYGAALDPESVALASVALAAERSPSDSGSEEPDDPERRAAAIQALRTAAGRVEGARVTALATGAPGYREAMTRVRTTVQADPDGEARDFTLVNGVDPDFFTLFDLDLLQGRALDAADDRGDEPVAVVNQAFVDRFWPTGSPVGRRVQLLAADSAWYRVVGVVETAELGDQRGMREDRVYLPLSRHASGAVRVLSRAADGDGTAHALRLRRALAAADPDRPVDDVRTLASGLAFMTRAQGTFSTLAAAGGGAGLLVAVVGLYAMLAFRVRRRRREMGVRKALGANGPTLVAEVLKSAMRQLLPAVAVGLTLAWIAAPLLGVILLGGHPRSPRVFAGVGLLFLCAGLAAALIPALRAGRVEPASVLRAE